MRFAANCPKMVSVFALLGWCMQLSTGRAAEPPGPASSVAEVKLREAIAAAPPYAVVSLRRDKPIVVRSPLVLDKPVTISGLNLYLPPQLGNTSLVVIRSEGVRLSDFTLRGNGDSVSQQMRAPLIAVHAGDFIIERGDLKNSSKDAVMIEPERGTGGITGGMIRNLVGEDVIRDVVSISGGIHADGVRNVVVENIRGYRSEKRGVVEVSDGSRDITVRHVYGEDCIYAVDVQDHNQKGQINREILLEDIRARRCKVAVRTANTEKGHAGLTVRDVVAEDCEAALRISKTDDVHVDRIRVVGQLASVASMVVENCNGVTIRNVSIVNSRSTTGAMRISNCNRVTIDGMLVDQQSSKLSSAVVHVLSSGEEYFGFCVRNVTAPHVRQAGIVMATEGAGGSLSGVVVDDNLATLERRDTARDGVNRGYPAPSLGSTPN